jgi:tRNA G10  N-methylase Trm11
MLICILGRQPSLGLAELEAMVGPESVQPFGGDYAIIKGGPEVLSQQELGGTIKIAEIVTTIPSTKRNKVSFTALNEIVRIMSENQNHKLTFGLSAYDLSASPKQITGLSFAIKKKLKDKGHTARAILGDGSTALNSAQVIHNGLLGKSGAEFLLVSGSQETYLAKTLSVQDIDSYSRRDYDRPKRDTQVGMLPPKLAQIMLNLAKSGPDLTVLDPFCGTGVVLMEAALKHSKLEGSDINPKMIEYTKVNLDWLSKNYNLKIDIEKLISADATIHKWGRFDCVVTETYLGPPIAYQPESKLLKTIVSDCNALVTKFLTNLRSQLSVKSRCCIAVPAWASPNGLIRLPVIDQLDKLGYNRVKFTHASFDQLIYHRPDQFVARELLVLTTK